MTGTMSLWRTTHWTCSVHFRIGSQHSPHIPLSVTFGSTTVCERVLDSVRTWLTTSTLEDITTLLVRSTTDDSRSKTPTPLTPCLSSSLKGSSVSTFRLPYDLCHQIEVSGPRTHDPMGRRRPHNLPSGRHNLPIDW